MRVFALSDVHADYHANMAWLQALSPTDYRNDVLLLAGDVSDALDKLQAALMAVRATFGQVFFVPGNHELWIRQGECADSLAKFWCVLALCASLGVRTSPGKIGTARSASSVWIVPLFSWYVRPEEGRDSLFVRKEGEDPTLEIWADTYFTKWPSFEQGTTVADMFLRMNEAYLQREYDAPVISFSHFVPRTELIFRTAQERESAEAKPRDAHPSFNFSRVAGCQGLETQIRRLGARIHVYGHQHRNRQRLIDGILYISHCLGYPSERESGYIHDVGSGPKLIWDTSGMCRKFSDHVAD
jgi:predicted phosphodiesterase